MMHTQILMLIIQPPPALSGFSWKKTTVRIRMKLSSVHLSFQIKQQLAQLIMDNGNKKNLLSQQLIEKIQISTTHPQPYHFGWIHEAILTLLLQCFIRFSIRPFIDTIDCDDTPFYCSDVIFSRALPISHKDTKLWVL